jgi:capsular exopolysaccharide synthesis family protein
MSRLDAALRRARQLNEQPSPRRADAPRITPRESPLETLPRTAPPRDVPRLRSASAGSESDVNDRLSRAVASIMARAPAEPTELAATLSSVNAISPSAGKLVVTADLEQSTVEQYRKLAATLHHAQADRDLKIVMITSAVSGDGKTLTSTNLALTLSESYRRRVLLIDADLRKPSLHEIFGAGNAAGLSECLTSDVEQPLPLIQASQFLSVVVAGRPDSDPMSGLTSTRMRRLLANAAATHDWVIIDTPPVVLLPDANLLTAMADAAILVIGAGKTPHRLVIRAVEALGRDRILGVVLNRVDRSLLVGGYGYGYGYGYAGRPQAGNHG